MHTRGKKTAHKKKNKNKSRKTVKDDKLESVLQKEKEEKRAAKKLAE